ncbi:DUF885 family protein [Nonomuraea sp. NPDC051941]|uniref:DUF885 family protein n=1 Tax=Nonomuraea sp. NPDC051941 TaxID=3364373 RepID=UPI0037C964D7
MTWADLVQRYLTVAVTHHPGYAFAWDEFTIPPTPVDPAALSGAYQSMSDQVDQVADAADDHEVRLLRWCLDDHRFELDTALSWHKDPQFWVDRQCYGILAQAATGGLRDRPLPPEWIRAFLANLPDLFGAGMRNLNRREAGQVDLRRAVRHLAASHRLLQQMGESAGGGCADEMARAGASIDRFSAWLSQAIGNGHPLRPMGAQIWEVGLRARTGIACGPEELEHVLRCQLDRSRREVARTPAAVPGRIARSVSEIDQLVARLAGIFLPRFDGKECLVSLRLDVSDDTVPWVTSASYQSAASRGGGPAVVFIRPGVYSNRADLELDLVHECFPGHHWQQTAQVRAHRSHRLCLRHSNPAFVEGWGRWCEGLYASLAADPSVNARFHARMAKYCGQALAALLVHARGRPFTEVVESLTTMGVCGSADAASLVMHSYFEPWRATAPIVGYLALRKLAVELGEREMEAMVAQNGVVDLFGKGLSGE